MGSTREDSNRILGSVVQTIITVTAFALSGGNPYVAAGAALATSYLFYVLQPSETIDNISSSNLSPSTNPAYRASTKANAYSVVPKVFGSHVLYPKIIADPFIIRIEGETWESVIYDFGFGPNEISSLKIGETDIGEFSGVRLRFVDIQRPASEDRAVYGSFKLQDSFEAFTRVVKTVFFQNDRMTGEYWGSSIWIQRRNPTKNTFKAQQIPVLNFSFPNGLFSNSLDGSQVGISSVLLRLRASALRDDGRTKPPINFLSKSNDKAQVKSDATYNASTGAWSFTGDLEVTGVPNQEQVIDYRQNYMPMGQQGINARNDNQVLMFPLAHKLGNTSPSELTTGNYYLTKAEIKAGLAQSGVEELTLNGNYLRRDYSDFRFLTDTQLERIDAVFGYPKGRKWIDVHHGFLLKPGDYPAEHAFWNVNGVGQASHTVDSTDIQYKIEKGAWLMAAPPQVYDGNEIFRLRNNKTPLRFGSIIGFIKGFQKPSDYSNSSTGKNKIRIYLQNALTRDEPVFALMRNDTGQIRSPGSTYHIASMHRGVRCWRGNSITSSKGIMNFNGHTGVAIEERNPFISLYLCNPHEHSVVVSSSSNDQTTFISVPGRLPPYDESNDTNNYQLLIERAIARDHSSGQNENETLLTSIQSYFDSASLVTATSKRHTFLQASFKKTNEENSIKQIPTDLNAVVTSLHTVYDRQRSRWRDNRKTNNPAWILADILTSEVNPDPINRSDLDLPSLQAFETFCNKTFDGDKNLEMNFVVDYETTISEIVRKILGQCRAGIRINNGKVSVFIDDKKSNITQLFTPKNSRDFYCSKQYQKDLTSVKSVFFDKDVNFVAQSTQAYKTANAYTGSNPNSIEVSSFGTTKLSQAFRYARYVLAQSIFRSETYKLTTDFENLLCNIGDRVLIAFDQIRGGGVSARITASSFIGGTHTVTLDEPVSVQPGSTYQMILRTETATGTRVVVISDLGARSHNSFTFTNQNISNDNNPAGAAGAGFRASVGDLCVVGQTGTTFIDCVVKEIIPKNDLQAELTLVPYNEDIFSSISSVAVPAHNPVINPGGTLPTKDIVIEQARGEPYCNRAGEPVVDLLFDWSRPSMGVVDGYTITYDAGSGSQTDDSSTNRYTLTIPANEATASFSVNPYQTVAGVKTYNSGLAPTRTYSKSYGRSYSHLTSFSEVASADNLTLNFTVAGGCLNNGVRIKYSRDDVGYDSANTIATVEKGKTSLVTELVPGFYYAKALDFQPREEAHARKIQFEAVSRDFVKVLSYVANPGFGSTKNNTTIEGSTLRVSQNYRRGIYAFTSDYIDLTDTFEDVKCVMTFAKATDLRDIKMRDWDSLRELTSLNYDYPGDRFTEVTFGVKAGNSGEYQEFLDAIRNATIETGMPEQTIPRVRYLTLVAKISSDKIGIRPGVTALKTEIFMRERSEIHSLSSVGGTDYTLDYNFSFYENPRVTISSVQSGFTVTAVNEQKNRVTLRSTNSNGVRESSSFVVSVAGAGKGT